MVEGGAWCGRVWAGRVIYDEMIHGDWMMMMVFITIRCTERTMRIRGVE